MSDRICSIKQCAKPLYARGWCRLHYDRWRAHGDPLATAWGIAGAKRWRDLVPQERFLLRVKDGPIVRPGLGPCRVWTGRCSGPWGYGSFTIDGLGMPPSRAAWLLFVGPIPDGLFVLHRCDNPPCVRWEAHLFLGTCQDNGIDMSEKGRGWNQGKDECPDGHAYDEANTYYAPGTGWRQCRICRRRRVAEYQARRRATR